MNSDMRGNVVALDGCDPALCPLALQIQIIRAFSPNMLLADVFLFDRQPWSGTTLQPAKFKSLSHMVIAHDQGGRPYI